MKAGKPSNAKIQSMMAKGKKGIDPERTYCAVESDGRVAGQWTGAELIETVEAMLALEEALKTNDPKLIDAAAKRAFGV